LARRFAGVVVNADSQQLYRELAILTARPDRAALTAAPHALFGVLGCVETASAAWWAHASRAAAREAWAAGRLPFLVGGTGLYIEAFLAGLAPVPEIPATVRDDVRARLARQGVAALHAELARRDPAGAARLRPTDRQRVGRALEVIEATGRPLTWWQGLARVGAHQGPVLALVLDPPRPVLYARCDRRWNAMLARGALDEAAAVGGLGLAPDSPAWKTLGLRELVNHLAGRYPLAEASRRARQATRNYAKRQVTWFRHRLPASHRIGDARPGDGLAGVDRLVNAFAVDRGWHSK
jgi:tRNA dimethylallyltransferase